MKEVWEELLSELNPLYAAISIGIFLIALMALLYVLS